MTLTGSMNNNNSSLFRSNIWGTANSMTAFTDESIVVNSNDTYASFSARMQTTEDGVHKLPATTTTVMNNLYGQYQKLVVKKFETYLEPVQEFDVTIQYLFNNDWYKLFRTGNNEKDIANWEDFLSNYDMVVFGFVDSNSYTSDTVFHTGIQDFVDQGKSMILTHDTVSGSDLVKFGNGNAKAGYTSNAVWLRTISGQRRAYYNKDEKTGKYVKSYNTVKANGVDISFVSDYVKSESSYSQLLGTYVPSDYGESGSSYLVNEYPDNNIFLSAHYLGREGSGLNVERVAKSGSLSGGWPTSAQTTFVKLTNNGQITTYPYKLNDVIQVLNSHVQNFQLDLDYEEGGDVNVWFNLSDQYDSDVAQYIKDNNITGYSTSKFFSAKDQDGRNNFYIYNKGNITYTGSGHGANTGGKPNALMTDDEVKLFVNTMIAAYRQPESEPEVSIDDPDGTDGEGRNLIYLDYDGYTFNQEDGTAGSNIKNGADSRVEIVDGKEQVLIPFSISDIGSDKLTDKKCYLSITQPSETGDKEVEVDPDTITLVEITTDEDGNETRKILSAEANGQYRVDSSGSRSYVLYFPYSQVRDGTGTVEYSFTTHATYTKKNRKVTTTAKKTTVDVMLLPLFDLD
jgi:hypothetical protein